MFGYNDLKICSRLCESYINLTINIPEETPEELEEDMQKDDIAEPQVRYEYLNLHRALTISF